MGEMDGREIGQIGEKDRANGKIMSTLTIVDDHDCNFSRKKL